MRHAPLALLAGCARYTSVGDACPSDLAGEASASDEAAAFFRRVSCARRYAGLPAVRVGAAESAAAERHAGWLGRHGIGDDFTAEDPDEPDSTGADVFARLEHQGFRLDGRPTWVRELLLPLRRGARETADAALHDPLVRDVVLAPGWQEAGFASFVDDRGEPTAYLLAVVEFPTGHARPVTWPVDGQEGVPIGIAELDTLPGVVGPIGYPITLTFGANSDPPTGDNPLGVEVVAATLTGPSGDVPLQVVTPTAGPTGPIRGTATLVPLELLEPDADYRLAATVRWLADPSRDLAIGFRTGSQTIPTPF